MKHLQKFIASALLAMVSTIMCAQKIEVSGTVVDPNGETIIGASIMEKGTTNGTVTDFDGNFKLTTASGAKIVVSYIGFMTQELNAEPTMKIVLKEDAQSLQEVVVTGYTTQRKADLTGSVAVVQTKDLKTSSDSDPMRALQGKVAGMTVTTDGSPSGTGTVRIRGIGSFNSSQDPLFVIDGVPTTATLNSLNMNDIESMQVLKDAASASIYGSRAANGVIIITTRKGKKGEKVKIDFSANLTAQFYTSQSTMDLCNSAEYATAMAQAALNDGLDPVAYASNYGLNLNATQGIGIKAYDPKTGQYNNYTVNGLYDGFINSKKTMRFSDTDWLDAISRTGFSQSYDLSISNATDKYSALMSLGYKKNNGILKYTDFENFSGRVNTSYNINKLVTIGENLTISYTNQVNSFPMENALKMSPTVPVYEEDNETFAGPVGGMSDRQNPLRELYHNRDNRLKVWRVFGNAYIDIKPIEGLVLRSNFGIDYDQGFIHSVNYTFHSDVVNNSTPSTTLSEANDMKWTWSNTANYNFTLWKDHHFGVLLGMEMHHQGRDEFSSYAEMFDLETYKYMWPDAATGTERATGIASGYNLVSFFGKADYNWKDLVLASFTIRRDGSSRFGRNNRYGTFPAATLGYRLSQNLKKDWLDDLKIRLSWGETGNQAISNNARYGLYIADYGNDRVTSTAYDLYLQGSGIFPSGFRAIQTENPNLKWETTIQYNAGIDFALFNNELYGTADIYLKKVEDMLIQPAYLASLGEGGASWSNGPSLENWGMEFTAGYRHTTAYGLGYNISGNLDFFRNRVTYLPETTTGSYVHTTTENLVQAKKPYGSIVGYVVDGLYQNREEVLACGQENARVGGLKYADLNGDGRINADDQTWIFNPVPNFSWGLNVSLNYKDFDLSMFFQGVCGVDIYNNQKFQTDFYSITDAGSNKGNRMLQAWTQDNTSSTIPALTTNNTGDEGRASTYYVEHGSWLKLRSLQIGYNMPSSLLKKVNMTSARFYVSGQNIFTLKSDGFTVSDPENPNWAYPHATSVSFGLQLGF
ncbi:TonB-dependent receptor [Prevotella sp. P3-122]|uniref:SusC/RagA family TonB-linked outer membrane protein n=1 Tax=Prevotella sp. P3-122 TaxID=2024223 RepID=UPI000B96A5B9|nr:TonB-dependent receptor [Prevotella sp. P3-122]OYP63081.1 SusC/RagA family TonB-linked outer membrane protein [Prevotella sp. P3-122]